MNLRNLDLNLLLVLDAVLEAGGVAGAASRLGLSQPAVSNALRRLHETLGRRLFTRHGRRLVPNAETLALAPLVHTALATLENGFFRTPRFEPKTADGIVTLAMSDYWHTQLLPVLVAYLERHAPGIQLQTTVTSEDVLAEGLPRGDVNAAIFLFPRVYPGLKAEVLISDGYALVVSSGHPLVGRTVTLRDFARQRQVQISPRGPWADTLGDALHREGLSPRIALLTSHVRVAMDIVARTEYVSVMPRRMAAQMQGEFSVRLLSLPAPTDGFKLALYWHERCADDPLQVWFRAVVARLARRVYQGGRGRPDRR